MKLLLVFLVATAAAVESRLCEPNSVYKYYCNTCHCTASGSNSLCTQMNCGIEIWNRDGTRKSESDQKSNIEESDIFCEPNNTFNNYCNTCTCSADGKTTTCTREDCDLKVWNRDGTQKSESVNESTTQKSCVPRTSYKEYCNTCTCLLDGKGYACTKLACDPKVWNEDGTMKVSPTSLVTDETKKNGIVVPRCEPGKLFSICRKNGFCSTMICPN